MLTVSERRACRALGQHRSTQRKVPGGRDDEAALLADLVELARRYGRYGYRKIAAPAAGGGLAGQRQAGGAAVAAGGAQGAGPSAQEGPVVGTGMAPVSGCGPSIAIMSGPTTSSKRARMTGARSAC